MASEKPPTILIVEDEFIIALGAAETFRKAGFQTVEASNADEAMAILEARRDIDVVFTDVWMPGSMDGLTLAHRVRKRWPPVKIIVTSGHHSFRAGDLPNGGVFVQKPYSDRCLTEALAELAHA
jgi:two-component system, response regulator PdtaR